MFRNYLAAALRNLARNRLYAAINIIGLAVGFAAAILIGLFIRGELSFDRWIPGHDRTFLVAESFHGPGTPIYHNTLTPANVATLLATDFAGRVETARLAPVWRAKPSIRHGEIEALEQLYWADPNFFSVLPLPAIAGDLATALERPDGIVLTRSLARKYFGRDDPVGETLEIDRQHVMRVTAVLEDLPSNTHLAVEIIGSGRASFSTISEHERLIAERGDTLTNSLATYLRLAPGASARTLRDALPDFANRHMPVLYRDNELRFFLRPLADLHLDPAGSNFMMRAAGSRDTLAAVAAVGLLIVLVAAANFVNLMTARATRRATEVGVRKTSGAARRHLVLQFIGESVLYVALGMALALVLAELALPLLNTQLGLHLAISYWRDPGLILAILVAIPLLGVLAGFYPAFVLSLFRPARVLKSTLPVISGSASVRQALVVLQFAVFIGLLLATGVLYRQTDFAIRQSLRLDTDPTLIVNTGCPEPFLDAVRRLDGVVTAGCSGAALVYGFDDSFAPARTADGRVVSLLVTSAGTGFFDAYGLQPLAGRGFSDERSDRVPADMARAADAPVLLNETAVRRLGFASAAAAIGQSVSLYDGKFGRPTIVGVVPDLPLHSIRTAVDPALFSYDPRRFRALSIKLRGDVLPETVAAIDALWKRAGEPRPIQRQFLDRHLEDKYQDVVRATRIFTGFSAVAIFIAALGLFGLSAFAAERRIKEIGIRKAMGAGAAEILRLLLWQFARPVLWANLIAWPAGFYLMNRWLAGFAYRIDLEPWMFLASGAAALLIALLTVAGHSILVARTRPVLALRYE